MTHPLAALRLLLAALLLPLFAGCITLPKTGGPFTNHVMRSIDDKGCMTASRWGPVAITGDLNESECTALIEALRARELLRLMEAQSRSQAAPAAPAAAGKGPGA